MNPAFLIILFLSAFLGGMAYFALKPDAINRNFKTLLTFAGSYMFSITLLHLIPELFEMSHEHGENHFNIGAYILLGFFIQKVLEFFSSGVEHGHFHQGHSHHYSPTLLLTSLCIHSFMEGTLLTDVHGHEEAHHGFDLLMGIVIHKAPAAFVLTMLLSLQHTQKMVTISLLALFSLASPAGMLLGNMLLTEGKEDLYLILYALVAGNFLHISTTIFIESSPEHKVEFKKIIAIALGVLCAFGIMFFH